MRTNIVIDDALLEEAFSVRRARTKKDLIHQALMEYVRLKKPKDMIELAGFIQFYKGFNHRKLRTTRGRFWSIPGSGFRFSLYPDIRSQFCPPLSFFPMSRAGPTFLFPS
jgi:hypothetical protein